MSILQFSPSIQKNNKKTSLLSQNQTAMWLDELFFKATNLYNLGGYYELKGALNIENFIKAVETVVVENDIFGIQLSKDINQPIQQFSKRVAYQMPFVDYADNAQGEKVCLAEMEQKFTIPLALEDTLFEFVLYKVATNHFFWFVKIHHVILDGWGLSLLVQQVANYYQKLSIAPNLRTVKMPSFQAYLEKEKQYIQSADFEIDRDYWVQKFTQLPPTLVTNKQLKQGHRTIGKLSEKSWLIPTSLQVKLEKLAKTYKVSMPQLWLGILGSYFYRLTQQTSICFGLPILNRHNDLERQTLGLFVGMIPHLMHFNETLNFEELVQQIKQTRRSDRRHQQFPLHQLIQSLPHQAVGNRNLFDVVISFDQHSYQLPLTNFETNFEFLRGGAEKTPLNLYLRQANTKEGIVLDFEYLPDYFSEWDISMMIQRLAIFLQNICLQPQLPVRQLSFVAKEEQQLLRRFSLQSTEYPADKSIVQLFEQQVEQTPNKIALVFKEKNWSYAALNQAANQVAHYLIDQYYIKANDKVALQMERSDWMIITILGILKSGAAYVPLATNLPSKRAEHILSESQVKVLLTDEVNQINSLNYGGIVPIEVVQQIQVTNSNNLYKIIHPQDLAYVMFTSGSTGQPKGVCVKHQNVVRLVKNTNYADFDAHHVFLHMAQVAFDAATFEIWGALLNGGKLVVMPFQQPSVAEIGQVIKDYTITTAWFTAGLFHVIVDQGIGYLRPLKQLLAGGDVLSPSHVQKVLTQLPDCTLINGYGPTENTTFTTCCQINDLSTFGATIPIGKPIANTEVYILDKQQNLLPIGIPGELYTGGAGLAKGYLNNPQLTAEKFIPHPFKKGAALYKTGDLARWLPDGNIEFLGRLDYQVKIRGFRIETGEIEQALLLHPTIKDAVVIGKTMDNGKELIAYLILNRSNPQDTNLSTKAIRTFLQAQLPPYMMPTYFVQMETFPLSPTGKVNRKALPIPMNTEGTTLGKYEAPQTKLEKKLVILWEIVLNLEKIGINENFFELGGHSLKAVQLAAQIEQKLGLQIKVSTIFQHPTIKALAQIIDQENAVVQVPIPNVRPQATYPLSRAQRRLLFLNNLDQQQATYNIPMTLHLEGELNQRILALALETLVARHEILRTNFVMVKGEARQIIRTVSNFQLTYKDWRNQTKFTLDEYLQTEATTPFDLEKELLLKATLIQLTGSKYVLFINIPHIIFDGWSLGIFLKELTQIYTTHLNGRSNPLTPLSLQYKDFVIWQNKCLEDTQKMHPIRAFWENQLIDLPTLELPTDFPRPAIQTYHGANWEVDFGKAALTQLEQLAQTHSATLFMAVTTLVTVLLHRYTQQSDIIIGTPSAGRNHLNLQQQIGYYANTLILRNQLNPLDGFLNTLIKVKKTTLKAFENEQFPFDELVQLLPNHTDRSRSPIFDVMVLLENEEQTQLMLKNTSIQLDRIKTNTSKFDLTFCFTKQEKGLTLNIEYNTDLFSADRIDRMAHHLEVLISSILETPESAISQLRLLPNEERSLVTHVFHQTQIPFSSAKTTIELFEEQVNKTPHHTAVQFGQQKLTYQALNEKANSLAHFLRIKYQIQPNDIIALQQTPSEWLMVTILGIMKAGAAYLPIGVDLPQRRIEHMLEDSQAKVLFSDTTSVRNIPTFPLADIAEIIESAPQIATQNLSPKVTPQDLAYIIYTSGSTGKPKGVAITYRSMVNYLEWANDFYFDNSPNFALPLHASIAFDMSITTLFSPLLRGAILTIYPQQEPSLSLTDIFNSNNPLKAVKLTPGHIDMLAFLKLPSTNIEKVIVGGEALHPRHVSTLRQLNPAITIYNEYGPTETTVGCSIQVIKSEKQAITIGVPIANTQIFILDRQMQLAPIGMVGELYIAGEGLAKGYLNRPILTNQKFIPHPFKEGVRMYKTGDLGRWQADGQIEYLGRKDHQLKIRGYRIEIGEIEAALLTFPTIQSVCVMGQKIKDTQHLVAYLVPKSGHTIDSSELRGALTDHLPSYMIPSFFSVLSQLPLTKGGKIDRKALPTVKTADFQNPTQYTAPRNELEQNLVTLWEAVLSLQDFGITANFFELGGNSLKIIELVAKMRSKFNLELPIQFVFAHPTIAQQAQYINTFVKSQILPTTQIGLRLNEGGSPTIFAFPGLMGLAIGFQQLSTALPDYSFFCFDFLPSQDRLVQYYQKIKAEQPVGPYTLLGYSAGGNLAYEMAAYMEKRGDHVAKIILGDCVVWESIANHDLHFDVDVYLQQTTFSMEQTNGKYAINPTNESLLKDMQQQAKERMTAYFDYLNEVKLHQTLQADIYQLLVDKTLNPYAAIYSYDWSIFTKGKFESLPASGTHEALLQSPNIEHNAGLIKRCLRD